MSFYGSYSMWNTNLRTPYASGFGGFGPYKFRGVRNNVHSSQPMTDTYVKKTDNTKMSKLKIAGIIAAAVVGTYLCRNGIKWGLDKVERGTSVVDKAFTKRFPNLGAACHNGKKALAMPFKAIGKIFSKAKK